MIPKLKTRLNGNTSMCLVEWLISTFSSSSMSFSMYEYCVFEIELTPFIITMNNSVSLLYVFLPRQKKFHMVALWGPKEFLPIIVDLITKFTLLSNPWYRG